MVPVAKKRSSKPKAAPRRRLRDDLAQVYRDAILEAAQKVFGESGFEAAKMADIAKAAGLAAGTLYNYFESKEHIFQSLVEYRFFGLGAQVEAFPVDELDARDALHGIVRIIFKHMDEHHEMLSIFLKMGIHSELSFRRLCGDRIVERRKKMLKVLEKLMKRGMKEGVIRDDVPAPDLVALLTGSMNGFLDAWLGGETKGPLAGRADLVVDVFLSGAGKGSRGR